MDYKTNLWARRINLLHSVDVRQKKVLKEGPMYRETWFLLGERLLKMDPERRTFKSKIHQDRLKAWFKPKPKKISAFRQRNSERENLRSLKRAG